MSVTALAAKAPDAPVVTSEQLDLVKRTVASGATDAELKLYLFDCARQGVHPLDKLLHFTKRGGKYTPVTSIDLMRTRAADTGEYAGSNDSEFVGKPGEAEFAATVTVTRLVQGTFATFTATARWSEYYPGDQSGTMWRKMPHTMLGKCAEALALRKGFPRQLAGLYAKEELDQADRPAGYVVEPPKTVVDVSTGDMVPAEQRPAVADGYAYLESCQLDGQWLNVIWNGLTYKTKMQQIAALAEQAFQDGLPVKLTSKKLPWLDKVEVYKPPVAREGQEEPPPIDDKDLPF